MKPAGNNALASIPKSIQQLKALKEKRELDRMDEVLNWALNKGAYLNLRRNTVSGGDEDA